MDTLEVIPTSTDVPNIFPQSSLLLFAHCPAWYFCLVFYIIMNFLMKKQIPGICALCFGYDTLSLRKKLLLHTWKFVLQLSFEMPVGTLMSGKVLSCLLIRLYKNLLSDPGFQRNETVSTRQRDLCETEQLW